MKYLPFFANIIKKLKPPKILSWQTVVLLSIFVWLTGFFAIGLYQELIAVFSWLLLIIGGGWFSAENPIEVGIFSVSAWVTGALICIFIFRSWNEQTPPIAYVTWPIISAAIAILPQVVKSGGKLKMPAPQIRQNLVILLSIHLLISCWIQFHFYIQNWLEKYPSLLADDFSKSAFVVKLPTSSPPIPKGSEILNAIELRIKKQIDNKPWPQVQQWLKTADIRINSFAQIAVKEITTTAESTVWKFEVKVLPTKRGYNLNTIAKWRGLGSQPGGYYLEKSCQISPIQKQTVLRLGAANSNTSPPVTVSFVQCSSVIKQ